MSIAGPRLDGEIKQPEPTLRLVGFRVMHAETGLMLRPACMSQLHAEQRRDKLLKKGIPAIVERTDGKPV